MKRAKQTLENKLFAEQAAQLAINSAIAVVERCIAEHREEQQKKFDKEIDSYFEWYTNHFNREEPNTDI